MTGRQEVILPPAATVADLISALRELPQDLLAGYRTPCGTVQLPSKVSIGPADYGLMAFIS